MSPPDSKIKYSVFYVYLSSCIILCYFTGIFYAVVRQFSMLFIDYKDYVLCILRVCVCECVCVCACVRAYTCLILLLLLSFSSFVTLYIFLHLTAMYYFGKARVGWVGG